MSTCGLDDKCCNDALQAGSCPRTMIFDSIFTSSVEKSKRATGPSPSAFSISRLRPIVTGGTTCGRHQYDRDAPLRPWRYERAARQQGARFEA
eukprot:5005035-Pleurochrysis_carterae.AAC.1